jgi:hypothetical protein
MRWKYESMDLWFDLRTQKLSEVLQDPGQMGPGTTRQRTSGRGPRAKGAGDAVRGCRGRDPGGEGGRGRASAGVGEGPRGRGRWGGAPAGTRVRWRRERAPVAGDGIRGHRGKGPGGGRQGGACPRSIGINDSWPDLSTQPHPIVWKCCIPILFLFQIMFSELFIFTFIKQQPSYSLWLLCRGRGCFIF